MWIDTHCHLDASDFDADRDAVVAQAHAAGVNHIVVPAVVRAAIPEANPGIYFSMSLAMTFPFNVIIGIPLYYQLVVYL